MRRDVAVGFTSAFALCLFCASLKASLLVELQLDAPAPCPDRAAIESMLASQVSQPPPVPPRVSARFVPDHNRWVLYMTLEGGQRVVTGDSCDALAEALVAMIALDIDPTAPPVDSAAGDSQHSSAVSESAPQDSVPLRAGVAPNAHDSTGWREFVPDRAPHDSAPQGRRRGVVEEPQREWPNRVGLSLLTLTEVGSLPAWSCGASLVARYGSPVGWAEISANALYPRYAATSAAPTKGGNIGWFASQLAVCRAPSDTWPVAGCVGAEIGDLFGYGVNTEHSNVGYALWTAMTAGAAYRGKLRHDLGLELRLGTAIPILRPDFGIQGHGRIHSPNLVSLRLMAGLSWR